MKEKKDNIKTKDLKNKIAILEQEIATLKNAHKSHIKGVNNLKDYPAFILGSIPAIIYCSKTSGDYAATFITENCKKYLGYTSEDFLSNPKFWIDHVHPQDRKRVFNDLKDITKKGYYTYEYRFLHKDGSYRYLFDEVNVVYDDKGNAEYIVGYVIDITNRKNAEGELLKYRERLIDLVNERTRELQESELRFRSLFNNTVDGILLADTATKKFALCNESITKMIGYTKEEIEHLGVLDIHPEKDLPYIIKQFELQSKKNFTLAKDIPVKRKDGSVFYADINSTPITLGKKKFLMGMFRDVTERKKMEEELIRSQKLESLAILTGGIVHDLNNILGVILGNVALAKDLISTESELGERCMRIETAAARLKNLTQQLLVFSKGLQPVKKTGFIKILIRETTDFTLLDSGITAKYSLPEDLWAVEYDEGQITQVITNIVLNAKQSMPRGGKIEVVAENIVLKNSDLLPLPKGKYIKISIKDEGKGIQREHLPNIFDPFFTTRKSGIGLGLATAFSITRKHGGLIDLASEESKGSTFSIYLPATKKKVTPKKMEVECHKLACKVLFMDDDEGFREVAGAMLKELGCDVFFAIEGGEAFKLYKKALNSEKPFDVVIVDLIVPGGMDGAEVIKKLRKIDSKCRIVLSSGYFQHSLMSKINKDEIDGIIPKPYMKKDLSEILKRIL